METILARPRRKSHQKTAQSVGRGHTHSEQLTDYFLGIDDLAVKRRKRSNEHRRTPLIIRAALFYLLFGNPEYAAMGRLKCSAVSVEDCPANLYVAGLHGNPPLAPLLHGCGIVSPTCRLSD